MHSTTSTASTLSPPEVLQFQHQILFENAGENQVFEGYMVRSGDRLMVRAFAGPGVDLFTVVRTPERAEQKAHVPGLAERVDMTQVGDDIYRVYRIGCGGAPGSTTTCERGGEPLEEVIDESGRLMRRRFPSAHGAGLTVTYDEHVVLCGRVSPRRIVLAWGQGERRMVIFTASCELRSAMPAELAR